MLTVGLVRQEIPDLGEPVRARATVDGRGPADEVRAPAKEHKDLPVPVGTGLETAVDAPSACRARFQRRRRRGDAVRVFAGPRLTALATAEPAEGTPADAGGAALGDGEPAASGPVAELAAEGAEATRADGTKLDAKKADGKRTDAARSDSAGAVAPRKAVRRRKAVKSKSVAKAPTKAVKAAGPARAAKPTKSAAAVKPPSSAKTVKPRVRARKPVKVQPATTDTDERE